VRHHALEKALVDGEVDLEVLDLKEGLARRGW
jgi:hypothetical protein